MSGTEGSYSFGHSGHELDRLIAQALLYAPITRTVLARAGIGPRSRVIDVGCGAGDVSLLLADMVGPDGAVLAIDRAPEALATTARRAAEAGLTQITVRAGDLDDLDPPGGYDAAVGRLVLCYIPQRIALLTRLAAALRPGGVLAFVEMDVSGAGSVPASALYDTCSGWVSETMRRGGFEPEMGSALFAAFAEAGLTAELAAFGIAAGGPDSLAVPYIADVVASLLPMIEAAGVAAPATVDAGTLAARMRAEPGIAGRTFYLPRLTGAWARTPNG